MLSLVNANRLNQLSNPKIYAISYKYSDYLPIDASFLYSNIVQVIGLQ